LSTLFLLTPEQNSALSVVKKFALIESCKGAKEALYALRALSGTIEIAEPCLASFMVALSLC
jgi:hypothetical protein